MRGVVDGAMLGSGGATGAEALAHRGSAVLGQDIAETLLEVAEHEPFAEVKLPIVRSLVQFQLDDECWREVGSRVVELLDAPPGATNRAECLSLLSDVPVPEAEERLRRIAADVTDPESLLAARLTTPRVGTDPDPMVAQVARLVGLLRAGEDAASTRAIACLRIEQYDVEPSLFEGALHSRDVDTRLWASIAVAKLGQFERLERILAELDDNPPSFMWGDPWSGYAVLSEAAPVPPTMYDALVALYDDERGRNQKLVIGALTGNWDAEGSPLGQQSQQERRETELPQLIELTSLDMDELYERIMSALRDRNVDAVQRWAHVDVVRRFDASRTGPIVSELVKASMDNAGTGRGMLWGNTTMDVVQGIGHVELPVRDIVSRYVNAAGPGMHPGQLGAVLGRVDDDVVATVVVDALSYASQQDRRGLAELLQAASWSASTGFTPYVGSGGPQAGAAPPSAPAIALESAAASAAAAAAAVAARQTSAPPPDPGFGGPPSPAPVVAPGGTRPSSPGSAAPQSLPPLQPAPLPEPQMSPPASGAKRGSWLPRLPRLRRRRGPRSAPAPELAGISTGGTLEMANGTHATVAQPYEAYPLLKAPAVVVARVPFEVSVGLDRYFDQATGVTGLIHVEAPPPVFTFEVEVVVDPKSLEIQGDAVVTLTVTKEAPYPSTTVTLTALTDPMLSGERTIRLLFRREGRIVGIAKRLLKVVDSADQVANTSPPLAPGRHMLDLAPLLDDEPPDLVVGLYRADEPGDMYVWDVYPLHGSFTLADEDRRTRIDQSAHDLATYTGRKMAADSFKGPPGYRELVGYGDLIQKNMPISVRAALRKVVADRDHAPAVLFLTEEASVPWELAVLRNPPLQTTYAGSAPFLGAHLAISRWPSDDADPAPAPAPRLGISRQAVVTAEYDGVKNWKRLPAAEAEAKEFAETYKPATPIPPRRADVEACLEGRTPVDLLHVALHGQADPTSQEDGLVLLEPDGEGWKAAFLTSFGVRGLAENQSTTPFVFLNACQVGAGDVLMGSFAGFAAAVLRTKASGVVAPLWNIDDTVAAKLSARFYKAAYGDPGAPVAEILRSFRAEYTREAVEKDPTGMTPTYVAYQFFGHPRFTIQRTPAAEE